MPKFRKKPVVVEARRFTGRNGTELLGWIQGRFDPSLKDDCLGNYFEIMTREGVMRAEKGDWIIQGVAGEFYPCKADIFDITYEPETT